MIEPLNPKSDDFQQLRYKKTVVPSGSCSQTYVCWAVTAGRLERLGPSAREFLQWHARDVGRIMPGRSAI